MAQDNEFTVGSIDVDGFNDYMTAYFGADAPQIDMEAANGNLAQATEGLSYVTADGQILYFEDLFNMYNGGEILPLYEQALTTFGVEGSDIGQKTTVGDGQAPNAKLATFETDVDQPITFSLDDKWSDDNSTVDDHRIYSLQANVGNITFDNGTGEFTYTPEPGYVGEVLITYTLADGFDPSIFDLNSDSSESKDWGNTVVGAVVIFVGEPAPEIAATDDYLTMEMDTTALVDVLNNDFDIVDGTVSPDKSTLTIQKCFL